MAEPVCTKFIAAVLKVWNETVALDKEPGKYISIACRKDREWYVGALTNWDDRKLQIDLSFLPTGSYKAEVFEDGINAHKNSTDFKHRIVDVPADRKLKIALAPGGGYGARIYASK